MSTQLKNSGVLKSADRKPSAPYFSFPLHEVRSDLIPVSRHQFHIAAIFNLTYPGSVHELRNKRSRLYRSDYPDISLMCIHANPVKPRTMYVLDSFVLPFLNLWCQNPSFRLNTINGKSHYHIDPEILHTERTNT